MSPVIVRIICLAAGYVCGLFNTAIVVGRITGTDIRKQGSGNAGTTNMLRVMGPVYGLIVLLGDALKAVIPMLIMKAIFGSLTSSYATTFAWPQIVLLWTGLGAILGHDFPFYTGFKGGKGIATGLGVALALDWRLGLLGIASFLIPFVITHYVSFCSLTMTSVMFGLVILVSLVYAFGGEIQIFTGADVAEIAAICAVIIFLAFFRHRTNIAKLKKGEERKTYVFKKNKTD
ncbi:MAG: glycerol-3-phosphate acyltransferase [Lachnospiraceae bacterium]|nr:glycerol-3-phosphate acyltransferase [Lachnospiraceae bacterium]